MRASKLRFPEGNFSTPSSGCEMPRLLVAMLKLSRFPLSISPRLLGQFVLTASPTLPTPASSVGPRTCTIGLRTDLSTAGGRICHQMPGKLQMK